MVFKVKWCGFDFGQCIMHPGGLRNPLVFGDICKELGKPELIPDKMRKYRILKEKYGTYGRIKEGHRDEIHSYVLDNDPEAIELFSEQEQERLAIAEGLVDALEYLKSQGIELQVISEMKKTLGPVGTDLVSKFLKRKGLLKYFKELITPQGKIDLQHDTLDPRYKGRTKKDGSLYDVLVQELKEQGIAPQEALMVGDKPETDIDPAHDRGFKTIQYTGYYDFGNSKADVVINSFEDLKKIVKGR
ncbi:MAG: HAD hydrolase-like protein [Deltaproteobacteria bacterium]|nr:MAG: HAD hydrolase-like protein [Deltaproteobacteria bacterium]